MKFIKIIALIMLSLLILSSCSQVGENNQSDTEQTVDDIMKQIIKNICMLMFTVLIFSVFSPILAAEQTETTT